MRNNASAERFGTAVLLACASGAAVSGMLVAATPVGGGTGLVFLPLVVGILGVMLAGHMMGRAVVGYALTPLLIGGWFFTFVLTSGVMPAGLILAIGVSVVAAVYPFSRPGTRLILQACGIGAALALIGVFLRLNDNPVSTWIAVIMNAVAVTVYAVASAISYRRSVRAVAPTTG